MGVAAAVEIPLFKPGCFQTNSDMSALQFCGVILDSANAFGVKAPTGTGQEIIGVLQNKPLSGEAAEIMTHGITKIVLGGTVAVGDALYCDAAGKFQLSVAADGKQIVGYALQAGALNEVVSMFLNAIGKG